MVKNIDLRQCLRQLNSQDIKGLIIFSYKKRRPVNLIRNAIPADANGNNNKSEICSQVMLNVH